MKRQAKNWEKILPVFLTKNMYPEKKKRNSYNSMLNRQPNLFSFGKRFEQTLH